MKRKRGGGEREARGGSQRRSRVRGEITVRS